MSALESRSHLSGAEASLIFVKEVPNRLNGYDLADAHRRPVIVRDSGRYVIEHAQNELTDRATHADFSLGGKRLCNQVRVRA